MKRIITASSFDDTISKQAQATIKSIEKFMKMAMGDSSMFFDNCDPTEFLHALHSAEDAINYYVQCRTKNRPDWYDWR